MAIIAAGQVCIIGISATQ